MNHLVGTVAPTVDSDPLLPHVVHTWSALAEGEREQIEIFRKAYERHADADPSTVPAWEVSPEDLPPSGWRALDDVTLLRFLRADRRKGAFDHEASMARLMKALAWRKTMRSDALLAVPADEAYESLRIRRWVGVDSSGRPVQFERLGAFLGSSNAKAFAPSEWLRHYARDLETTFAQLRAAAVSSGAPVTNYLYCADFAGGGGIIWHMNTVIPLLKMLTKEVESHFPEIVGNIVIFNAPRVFASLFPMVKAFMDPITAAKVEVHAAVPTERFRALMDESAIPREYGGTNTAPYPLMRLSNDGDIVNPIEELTM